MNLKGLNAIVTGGSRGIGRAICIALAQKGVNVGINYISHENRAKEVLEEIEKLGVSGVLLKADVSHSGQVKNMVEEFVERFGKVDILVNNAGVFPKNFKVLEISDDEWDWLMRINLRGAFIVSREVLKYMPDGGKIVNISSIAGKMGGVAGPHYAASKAGLIGLTFALASELVGRKITVNAVAPGPVDTEMIPDEIKERLANITPLGRIATPEEIAHVVIFLLENDYITGEVVDINGGRYMD